MTHSDSADAFCVLLVSFLPTALQNAPAAPLRPHCMAAVLNDNAIFDLICLPLQIDYGRLGLTRTRPMRSPASLSKDSAYDAEKIVLCWRSYFFNRIGPELTCRHVRSFDAKRGKADIVRIGRNRRD